MSSTVERRIEASCGKCSALVRVTYLPTPPQPMDDGQRSIECPKCQGRVHMQFHGTEVDVDYAGSGTEES